MTVHTLGDIVGPVTAASLAVDPSLTAKWILFTATTAASAGVQGAVVAGKGDTVGPVNGAHLQQNVPVLYPPNPTDPTDVYQLSQMQVYVPSGVTLTITYGS
jgi:hypothetical protein